MKSLFETSIFFFTTPFHDPITKFHDVRKVGNRNTD